MATYTYNYNATDSAHTDVNGTDFEGSADVNGFSLYIPTSLTFNPASNSTTVVFSYMLHERLNNFSAYSQTTWAQYKTNNAASYTRCYAPSTATQYTAMTKNSYYWMGNNDGTPAIAFASIPSSGTVTTPTATYNPYAGTTTAAHSWQFTVNHDANGAPPATTIQAWCDSNTNASYVPVGTTITATLTTILGSATTNLNYRTPYFVTNPQISASTVSRPTPSTIRVKLSTPASTNSAANNTITYVYKLYIDGVLSSTSTAQAEGVLYQFPDIAVSAAASHSVYVTATDNTGNAGTSTASSTITSAGIPSAATVTSVSESSSQSREVTIGWTIGSNNGSAITSQSFAFSQYSNMSGAITKSLSSTSTSYTIAAASGDLLPNTTYYYQITETNAVGSTSTTVASFTTRPSGPLISPSAGSTPSSRGVVNVWNGTGWSVGNVMVYDGTTPYSLSGWKYLK